MTSALQGVINQLKNGERISPEAIDEIRRILQLLQDEGWSGLITADQALASIIGASP